MKASEGLAPNQKLVLLKSGKTLQFQGAKLTLPKWAPPVSLILTDDSGREPWVEWEKPGMMVGVVGTK